MELVTGAMGSLLPKLGELLKEEYGLQQGVKKKIESLSRELEIAHGVLREIGDVPLEQVDELIRLWVREVREASYDMEDIVDKFLVRSIDGPEPTDDPHVLRRLRKKVGKLFKKSKDRRKISTLIQEINKKLDEVAARRGRYTVDSIVVNSAAATTIDPRLYNLYKRATDLVGIDGPRDELINKLSLEGDIDVSDKMKVVSVVGFGGLGKTTLAKAVCDHLKPHFVCRASVPVVDHNPDMNIAVSDHLKPHFECGAFVVVGRNPDMKKVFRDILIDLDKEKYTSLDMMVLDEKQLMDRLQEFVNEKRCFIVIDDIWDLKSWKLIRSALQDSNCGCRVIVTTRISKVATDAGEAYRIQALSRENSEKLLYARIVDGEGKYFDLPSPEACDKILKKCGGVPLAIITIASLLANKPGEDWSEVYNSIGFGHDEDNDDVGNTRRILSFSYYDLPSHLKACLLYLSVFSDDDVIEKNNLIWKWIAEGFIHEDHAAAIGSFELGERYFNELINRSMIQPKETKYEGYVDACYVHDMVLDLIHSISGIENFVTVLDGNDRHKLPGSIARRLALQHTKVPNGQLANIAVDKVRSLIASQCEFGSPCPRLLVLRVLDMVDCHVQKYGDKCMLGHLGSLPHLRYLGLAITYMRKLPREVGYLKFLQTLDLWATRIYDELPEEVGLLVQLVCLRLDRRTKVSAGLIGKLSSLQELWIWPASGSDGDDVVTMQFVKDLGMLKALRVLRTKINITSESMERSLLESLGNLSNIRTMHIEGAGPDKGTSDEGFVSYRSLQFLYLEPFVFFGLPAAWIKSSLAPNLSYLDLKVLAVKEQDMENLARLPELCCLVLRARDTKFVSIKIINDGVVYFWKLRILRISGPFVRFDLCKCNGSVASTIMPSLESLQFEVHVRSLKDTTQLGFEKLLGFESLGRTSLQRITIEVKCGGARASEVEEVEAVLVHATAVHPKHPRLQTTWLEENNVLSPYQEACMDMSKHPPELVKKAWELANIVGPGHIRAMRAPDPAAFSHKVSCLLYTNYGMALCALSSSAVHRMWKWERNGRNPRDKSTTSVPPLLWQPENGILMTNDTTDGNPEEATACNALSKNESYLISASGGKISLFNMTTFKVMTTFMPPPPAATFLAFNPQDNNIIAIGREDSSIQIYNVRIDDVRIVLRGHENKITGLAFSQLMGVLVSSGADAQLCAWSIDSWEKKKSRYIQPPSSNASGGLVGDTMVQFHYDQIHILVVHESQLAIYNEKLECLCLWSPRDALPSLVSSAVYSSDGLLVYAGFCDGAIGIFEAESLRLQCRIAPSAYIPSSISSDGGNVVYPTVVAAHPWKPYQIAVGMSDGAVHVLEPLLDTDVEVGSKTSSGEVPLGDISSTSSSGE